MLDFYSLLTQLVVDIILHLKFLLKMHIYADLKFQMVGRLSVIYFGIRKPMNIVQDLCLCSLDHNSMLNMQGRK